jgi:hypothetical protein
MLLLALIVISRRRRGFGRINELTVVESLGGEDLFPCHHAFFHQDVLGRGGGREERREGRVGVGPSRVCEGGKERRGKRQTERQPGSGTFTMVTCGVWGCVWVM